MKKSRINLIIILASAVILRLFVAYFSEGYFSDLLAFRNWAEDIFANGPSFMYTPEAGCDYPPGYLYVLWGLGAVIELLKNINADARWIFFVLKLPSIICDILTAVLIYKIALPRQKEKKALILMCLYLFNPAVIINSSVWGQVDAVLALFVLITVYLVYKRKLHLSYLSFCIGFLLKPQIIFIAPIVGFGIIENVFLNGFSWKNFFKQLISGLGAVLLCLLLCIPFGLERVVTRYDNTMSNYPFASLNAYNFWTMQGLNWQPQDSKWLFNIPAYIWGYAFIAIICILLLYIWLFVYKTKKERINACFFLSALLIMGVFTFSVRMHERYMFPALALFLAFCAIYMTKGNLILYSIISLVHFVNVCIVYNFSYSEPNDKFIVPEVLCGIAIVLVCIYSFNMAFHLYKKHRS